VSLKPVYRLKYR